MRVMKAVFWLLCGVGGYGWFLGATELLRPPSGVQVVVTVTPESFARAHGLCGKYMRAVNGVIGQVGLTTIEGDNVVLPCAVVLKEEKR